MRAVKGSLDHSFNRCLKQGGPRSTRAVETTPVVSLKTDRGRDAESKWGVNQGGLDDVHESAENVSRVFWFLMDSVRDDGQAHQASHLPHISTFLCHAPTRKRLGHSNCPGVVGASRCQNNNDLHPCPSSWAGGRSQSVGRDVNPCKEECYTDPHKNPS